MRYSLLSLFLALTVMCATAAPLDAPADLSALGLAISVDPKTVAHLRTVNITAGHDADSARATIHCQTTTGSPRLHDIDAVINVLAAHSNEWCHQSNAFGSFCTKNAWLGNLAAASLCGELTKMRCGEMARQVRAIKDRCQWSMYSGGYSVIDWTLSVVLHK